MSEVAGVVVVVLATSLTLVYMRLVHWKIEAKSLARRLDDAERAYHGLAKRTAKREVPTGSARDTREKSTTYGPLKVYDGGRK